MGGSLHSQFVNSMHYDPGWTKHLNIVTHTSYTHTHPLTHPLTHRCTHCICEMEKQTFLRIPHRHRTPRMGTTQVSHIHTLLKLLSLYTKCESLSFQAFQLFTKRELLGNCTVIHVRTMIAPLEGVYVKQSCLNKRVVFDDVCTSQSRSFCFVLGCTHTHAPRERELKVNYPYTRVRVVQLIDAYRAF